MIPTTNTRTTILAPLSFHLVAEICICAYKPTCSTLLISEGIYHCPEDVLLFFNLENVYLGCAFLSCFSMYLYLKTQSEYMVHDRKPGLTERELSGSVILAQINAFHFCYEIFKFQNNTFYSHILRCKRNTLILVSSRTIFFSNTFFLT